jgi:hypothetical protein
MATLRQLRQGPLDEYGTDSPAMTMMITLAVMTYANALRVQGWIGDLALVIEHELFAEDSLKVKLSQQNGTQFDGLAVEETLWRLREQLLPLYERANRQLLQNLQALQCRQPGPLPTVAIGRAGQVNVAQQQVHVQKRDARSLQPLEPR